MIIEILLQRFVRSFRNSSHGSVFAIVVLLWGISSSSSVSYLSVSVSLSCGFDSSLGTSFSSSSISCCLEMPLFKCLLRLSELATWRKQPVHWYLPTTAGGRVKQILWCSWTVLLVSVAIRYYLIHIMTKPAFAICEQQRRRRRRSACASDLRSLINAFVVRCLDSIIPLLAKSKIISY